MAYLIVERYTQAISNLIFILLTATLVLFLTRSTKKTSGKILRILWFILSLDLILDALILVLWMLRTDLSRIRIGWALLCLAAGLTALILLQQKAVEDWIVRPERIKEPEKVGVV